jgi:hypothetical protein
MGVPRRPEEITAQLLTTALAEGGVLDGAKVASVEVQAIGGGVGLLGQLARLKIAYEGDAAGAPATVIAKMPTTNAGNREIGNLFQFYEREARFYEDVAPGIEIRVPRCYYRVMDVAADEHLLLLEDLSMSTPGDEVAGCTPEQAEVAIRTIARHHAVWWEHPKLLELDWMPFINAPVNQSAEESFQQAWGPYCEIFGDMLTPYLREVGERMQTKIIDLLNNLEPAPRTIIHGDFRLDNMFFDHPDGSPLAVIDWQISNKGRGIFDVAYFLCSSLEADVRKANEMRLLRAWHDTVVDGGAKSYSFDEALYDYRKAILLCNLYTVIGVGSMDAANERGLALQKAWIRRRGAALEDLDCAETMPK